MPVPYPVPQAIPQPVLQPVQAPNQPLVIREKEPSAALRIGEDLINAVGQAAIFSSIMGGPRQTVTGEAPRARVSENPPLIQQPPQAPQPPQVASRPPFPHDLSQVRLRPIPQVQAQPAAQAPVNPFSQVRLRPIPQVQPAAQAPVNPFSQVRLGSVQVQAQPAAQAPVNPFSQVRLRPVERVQVQPIDPPPAFERTRIRLRAPQASPIPQLLPAAGGPILGTPPPGRNQAAEGRPRNEVVPQAPNVNRVAARGSREEYRQAEENQANNPGMSERELWEAAERVRNEPRRNLNQEYGGVDDLLINLTEAEKRLPKSEKVKLLTQRRQNRDAQRRSTPVASLLAQNAVLDQQQRSLERRSNPQRALLLSPNEPRSDQNNDIVSQGGGRFGGERWRFEQYRSGEQRDYWSNP
jgi:hypothetical protein